MTPARRPYQVKLNDDIHAAFDRGARTVLAELPTGGGKTVCMAHENAEEKGASIDIAHRQELVGQMSVALARNGVRHRIVAPRAVCAAIVRKHMDKVGRSYYDPNAWAGVAGVDTLIRRPPTDPWFHQIRLWQTDEAHHLLKNNKWGKATELFPNARGIGWTATPGRADGYGLGRHADGVMDAMVSGPTMRELIRNGYLTDYRLLCPPSDLDLSNVPITATGDYSAPKLRAAVHKSHITGDIVRTYLQYAKGLKGVTFAVDVEHAQEIAQAFRAAGVRAEIVTAETPDTLRESILRRFEKGEIDQLVNVDLFGEGFDLPAIQCVSMGRPTESFSLFAQQFGRALRLMIADAIARSWDAYSVSERLAYIASSGKPYGWIFDHAGNTARHYGPPDKPRLWTLDRRERRGAHHPIDAIPMRTCGDCTAPYERTFQRCPYCGAIPEITDRSRPEFVDGDLMELSPEMLASLRGEINRIDGHFWPPRGMPAPIAGSVAAKHYERQNAQEILRHQIHLWAGWHKHQGQSDSEIYKRFFWGYGTDVMTAQTLGTNDALYLAAQIMSELGVHGVVAEG